jgi:hypothetical protein
MRGMQHGPVPTAGRATFNPSRLVTLAMEMLGQRGVPTTVDDITAGPAVYAAADLLRALGVTPSNAPTVPGM